MNLLVTWIEDRSWMRYWQYMKMYLWNLIEVDVISSLIRWHLDWAYIVSYDFDERDSIISLFILWWASRIVNECARQHWKGEASMEYNAIIQRDISNDMFIAEKWSLRRKINVNSPLYETLKLMEGDDRSSAASGERGVLCCLRYWVKKFNSCIIWCW